MTADSPESPQEPLPHANSDAPLPEPASKIRLIVFALACGTSFLLYLHRYTWNFIGPALQEQFQWSDTQTQAVYSLFMWTYAIGQIPSGILCDLLGPHLFLGAIIITWSIVLPLHVVRSEWGIAGARLAFGAAQAGGYPILARITRAWFPSSYRTTVQGWIATVFGRGGGASCQFILATVLMGWLTFSLTQSLLILSIAGVLFGFLFLLLFRNSPEVDPRVNAAELRHIQEGELPVAVVTKRRVIPWGRALKNRSMLFFVLMQMLIAGVDTLYSSLLGRYFLARGVSLANAGMLASLPLMGGMLGGLIAASSNDWILNRFQNRRWGRSSVGIFSNLMAGSMMLIMIQQNSVLGAALGLAAVKFFADMNQPTQWGACTDIGGRHFSATVFAVINTAGNIGGIIFPVVFGWILDMTKTTVASADGTQIQTNFTPMLFFAAGMYVTGGLCWLFIDSSRSLDDEPGEKR